MNEVPNSEQKIEWLAPAYEHKEQSVDWYWALGVTVVTGAVASIIWDDHFFALILIIGGLLLGYFAYKKPDMVDYELNNEGFKIKNRVYLYEDIKSFWVKEGDKPTLFVCTKRFFIPEIPIPLYPGITEKVRNKMIEKKVEEKETDDHMSVKVMDYLGF